MKSLFLSSLLCLLCSFAAISSSSAAPPAITYLHPAGAQRGTSVDVTAAGTLDAATKVWVDGKGVSVETAKGKLKITVAKDAVPGTYWLRAHNTEGASSLRPFIVGMLPEMMEKEPNDDRKKPHVMEGSTVVNGKLEKAGDVDCFAVTLKKGQTLVASLEANRTLRSPMDAMLQILSADGFVLDENNDYHGLDPQLAYTARKDGTYIARVYAFPATPDSSIRHFGSDACVYRLTLTTGAFADHAMPLAFGDNSRSPPVLKGWNIPPAVEKANETSLTVDLANRKKTHSTVFHPEVANPVRVRLERSYGPINPFDPEDRHLFVVPFATTGRIENARGESRFRFDVRKGKPLSIEVESRTFGLSVNPVIRVLDKEGKQLARAEPGKLNSDTTLAFSPPADGVYTVAVRDLFAGGGPRHVFLLRVLSEPDYDLTVAADRFTAAPGKPLSIPVKVNRVRGFKMPVEVVAEGLPDGVKVEVATPAKPDPGTITLSLTAEKPWSGTFQLFGKVKDEPKLTRAARFAMPEFGETTHHLWLTVPAK